MGKHFNKDEINSDSEKNYEIKPHNIYKKAAGNLSAVIICVFLVVPILYTIYTSGRNDQGTLMALGLALFVVSIIIISCLICAVENYMWAKDAEWTEIIEKLDQINSSIERVYNMEYSINMHIHEGMNPEEHRQ